MSYFRPAPWKPWSEREGFHPKKALKDALRPPPGNNSAIHSPTSIFSYWDRVADIVSLPVASSVGCRSSPWPGIVGPIARG